MLSRNSDTSAGPPLRAPLVRLIIVLLACASSLLAASLFAAEGTNGKVAKPEAKAPSDPLMERGGKSWGLVIGVSEYEKLPDLRYAATDAKAMAGLLERKGFTVA